MDEKKKFARLIGEAGLGLGTGVMAGLSLEETKYQDYVDLIFHLKEYEHLANVYVSKFFPVKGIPLEKYPKCSSWEAVRVISIMRLILRNIDIGAAAGWERNEYPTPLMAGSGNRAGGIHINRSPQYDMSSSRNVKCTYEDNMEFYNNMEAMERSYNELGVKIVAV